MRPDFFQSDLVIPIFLTGFSFNLNYGLTIKGFNYAVSSSIGTGKIICFSYLNKQKTKDNVLETSRFVLLRSGTWNVRLLPGCFMQPVQNEARSPQIGPLIPIFNTEFNQFFLQPQLRS